MDDTRIYGPIWISPGRVSGTPCFTNTRVPVQHLFDYLETGETLDEFLIDFPTVTKEQALEVLKIASSLLAKPDKLGEVVA